MKREPGNGCREFGGRDLEEIEPEGWVKDCWKKKNGRAEWIRTTDLHTPSVAHYQTVLRPDFQTVSWQGLGC